MRAGADILASNHRTIAIQGVAGAGKSAKLRPVARLLEAEGRPVLGLAVSNTIAGRLSADVGIRAQTITKFFRDHRAAIDTAVSAATRAAAVDALHGAVLLVDEASMLSTADARRLVAIANAAGVGRLALIGDTKQLGAVEAGKPFAAMQDRDTAHMRENLRARDRLVRKVHAAAQGHDLPGLAKAIEGPTRTTEQTAREAAEGWMALGPEDRARTMIFVTGRALKAAVNEAVQTMRAERGETAPGFTVRGVLSQVHLTREEQRHPHHYREGQKLLLARPLTAQRLPAGAMTILGRGERGALRVRLADGRETLFRPGRLAANRVADAVQLFEPRDLALRIGDPIVWRANDPARGLINSDRAVLAAVEGRTALFVKADGKPLRMATDDPALKRIDLAYALNAHAAQGATADRAIVVARSDEGRLITPPLLTVLFTRPRDEVALITDSLDKLIGRASRNPGAKTSATEIAGARAPAKPKQLELTVPPAPAKETTVQERSRERDMGR
jgi:ATP-dependent exoDNAse (exonuclease V) alpha subunit